MAGVIIMFEVWVSLDIWLRLGGLLLRSDIRLALGLLLAFALKLNLESELVLG